MKKRMDAHSCDPGNQNMKTDENESKLLGFLQERGNIHYLLLQNPLRRTFWKLISHLWVFVSWFVELCESQEELLLNSAPSSLEHHLPSSTTAYSNASLEGPWRFPLTALLISKRIRGQNPSEWAMIASLDPCCVDTPHIKFIKMFWISMDNKDCLLFLYLNVFGGLKYASFSTLLGKE